jgi:hypothetical protein
MCYTCRSTLPSSGNVAVYPGSMLPPLKGRAGERPDALVVGEECLLSAGGPGGGTVLEWALPDPLAVVKDAQPQATHYLPDTGYPKEYSRVNCMQVGQPQFFPLRTVWRWPSHTFLTRLTCECRGLRCDKPQSLQAWLQRQMYSFLFVREPYGHRQSLGRFTDRKDSARMHTQFFLSQGLSANI